MTGHIEWFTRIFNHKGFSTSSNVAFEVNYVFETLSLTVHIVPVQNCVPERQNWRRIVILTEAKVRLHMYPFIAMKVHLYAYFCLKV